MGELGTISHAFALEPGFRRGDSILLIGQAQSRWDLDSCPGRYGLIVVAPSIASAAARGAFEALDNAGALVDSGRAAFFAAFPGAGAGADLKEKFPWVRFLDPADDWVSAFGAGSDGAWVIVDPMLRIVSIAALGDREPIFSLLADLATPALDRCTGPAPILVLPDVFEPNLCRHLVDLFNRDGGKQTGFMQDIEGKPVERFDQNWKRRRDIVLSDPPLIAAIRARIGRRVCPEIKKAFQFMASRTERDLVARYDAEEGGRFLPHRDDEGESVAHRRFALSVPLNADFDGGELAFPEYSAQRFKPAPGAAVVFSASILHSVASLTRGSRYVFLTFLFDEQAEKARLAKLGVWR